MALPDFDIQLRMDPRAQLLLHTRGAELFVHSQTGEYYWRDANWVAGPKRAGVVPSWVDFDTNPTVSRHIKIRWATGTERRQLRRRLRLLLKNSDPLEPLAAEAGPHTETRQDLAQLMNVFKCQLPCNGSQLRPIALGLLAPAPPRAVQILQTLDHVVLTHVPTSQYYMQLVAMVTGTPRLLKRKRCQQLEAQKVDHLCCRVRLGTTGQEELKRLPRAIAQMSLLLLAAASTVRPLQVGLPTDPLAELAGLLRDSCTWLTRRSHDPTDIFAVHRCVPALAAAV